MDKESELKRAYAEVQKQYPVLKKERSNIETTIKAELTQRQKISDEYTAMIQKFAEEEKRQQEERQKKELAARQEEQRKFEEALAQTRLTTEKAYTLRRRELEMQADR